MADSKQKPFLWGVATSSHQIEGYNENNDWWHWEKSGRIQGGAHSGVACDHRNRFREDLRLAKDIACNAYRFSFEWSRIEPKPGYIDPAAISWYHDLIDACHRNNLVPMATLHHFTSPQWFAQQGGFASPKSIAAFSNFVSIIKKNFGERISLWCVFNEPMVLIAGTYFAEFMPPARFNPIAGIRALENIIHCHANAYSILKQNSCHRPDGIHKTQVGIAHNMLAFRPERNTSTFDQFFAKSIEGYYNRGLIKILTGHKARMGIPLLLRGIRLDKHVTDQCWLDFIGLNYYTKCYVRFMPRVSETGWSSRLPIGIHHARPDEERSDMQWCIYPKGMRQALDYLNRFKLPIYITENGIADREDKHRQTFIQHHLSVVAQAIDDGLDIRGYFHWSLLDNFEWIFGYGPRFGLYAVDYETQRRKPRKSALYYKNVIERHNGSRPQLHLIESFTPE